MASILKIVAGLQYFMISNNEVHRYNSRINNNFYINLINVKGSMNILFVKDLTCYNELSSHIKPIKISAVLVRVYWIYKKIRLYNFN